VSERDIVERLRDSAKYYDPVTPTFCERVADEIERLRAVLDAIDALHQPIDNPYDSEPNSLCGHCLHQWPCETHRLLHPEEARRER
jgi:hypothetical protein